MNYREIKTDGFLSHFIKCFWQSNALEDADLTILPDGYFDLILEFRNDKLQLIKLTGLWTMPLDISKVKNTKQLAIRFKPIASEYLFAIDFKTFLNSVAILPLDFWNLNTLNLNELEDFAAHCEKYCWDVLKDKKVDDKKLKIFELVFKKETLLVREIAEKIVWDSRQINRYFNKQYGIPLKMYLNIIRCNEAYKKIATEMPQSDYFDQAHFIREIKKFTGVLPKDLSKNEKDRFLQLSTLSKK